MNLFEAYRTELGSANNDADRNFEPTEVSKAKSTLPFAIIQQIARLLVKNSSQEVESAVDSVVVNLATSFWVIDDLIDIISDFQNKALNSILVRASSGSVWGQESSENHQVLIRLLEGSYIEEAADKICNHIISMLNTLQSSNLPSDAATRFSLVILFYTRNWME